MESGCKCARMEKQAIMAMFTFIYGAGQLGRMIASDHGDIFAFIDDTPAKIGSNIDGKPVISLDQFIEYYSQRHHVIYLCVCLPGVCVFSMTQEIKKKARNDINILPFTDYFIKNQTSKVLPYLFWDEKGFNGELEESYRGIRSGLNDTESVKFLDYFVHAQTHGLDIKSVCSDRKDVDFLKSNISSGTHYIDCGAYDGDTVLNFIDFCGHEFKKITAIEPDPNNVEKMRKMLSEIDVSIAEKITVKPVAIGGKRGYVNFDAQGMMSSGIREDGSCRVEIVGLREFINEPNLFIKLDIEGEEVDAIFSAISEIETYRPTLAISVYHGSEHLIAIYNKLNQKIRGYRYSLRIHGYNAADAMLYCYI